MLPSQLDDPFVELSEDGLVEAALRAVGGRRRSVNGSAAPLDRDHDGIACERA